MQNKIMSFVALMLLTAVAWAGSMVDGLENKIADLIFRAQTYTPPTTLCVALTTGAAPGDTATAATMGEASYTGYARAQLNPSVSNWKGTGSETSGASAGTTGTVKNNATLTFGTTATSGPTVVTGACVLDSCTIGSGATLFCSSLTTSKTINSGDPAPTLPVDALTIQIDN